MLNHLSDLPSGDIGTIEPVGVFQHKARAILVHHRVGNITRLRYVVSIDNLVGLDVAWFSVVDDANIHRIKPSARGFLITGLIVVIYFVLFRGVSAV